MSRGKSPYDEKAKEYSERYESLTFEKVHVDIMPFIPSSPARILDVGAGSGRDAVWYASRGHDVTAVEPSTGMLLEAQKRHKDASVTWIQDGLPDLEKIRKKGEKFDFIHLSAVWMHVRPDAREAAFENLTSLLAEGGRMPISLRLGQPDSDRRMYPIDVAQMKDFARRYGLEIAHFSAGGARDLQKRGDVHWGYICYQKPGETRKKRRVARPLRRRPGKPRE